MPRLALMLGCAALAVASSGATAAATPPAAGQYRLHVPNPGSDAPLSNPSTVPSGDSGSNVAPIALAALAALTGAVAVAAYVRRSRRPDSKT
jgi:hypothetical protein